jgi:hypothetical protein
MDYFKFRHLKVTALLLAMISMTACSSSQVDEPTGDTPETAAVGEADSSLPTDAVPEVADVPPAPDGEVKAAEAASPVAEDPALAAAPAAEAPAAEAPVAESPVAEAPPAEAPAAPPVAAAPVEEAAPVEPSVVARAAPEKEAAAGVDGKPYRVRRGDTLMKIAFEHYGDLYRWKEIYETNRQAIKDPNHVPPGTKIVLSDAGMVSIERNGERYLIKRGDTLGTISGDVYGTRAKWKKLWENNRQLIKDPNKIYAGFSLYYVPEARLTRDRKGEPEAAPGESAQNLPFKNAPVEKSMAQAPAAAPAQAAAPVDPAASGDAARAPASAPPAVK